ncbi:MAG: SRPBCC family protein [Acidimicrobiaceae bacterium]|nr:SRPBCC family protein [Acidimicrobiaceae bacterium]
MTERSVVHSTFTLERIYAAPISEVFRAWADPQIKVRWFAGNPADYELDFRPGGLERNSGIHDGKKITWESLYREIVPDERVVYTSLLREEETVATVSLTTVELAPEDNGTRLVLVEAGAYLDGRELPAWREQGTGDWLDALGRHLVHGK